LTSTWTRIADNNILERSSLCCSVVDSTIYIFGGELEPRQPRDNHVISLATKPGTKLRSIGFTDAVPRPRVGAASTVLNGHVYVFSGRGGEAMTPLEEEGALWRFEPSTSLWSSIEPTSETAPEARSYHCMTSDGMKTIYVHAGCPAKGRLADLWAFDVEARQWR
jgi:N-acetylneuraminic acid mutarotase